MNSRLLTCTDTDSLSIAYISHGVGLCVFQSNHSDCEVINCALRNVLVLCGTICEKLIVDNKLVSSLLKGNSVNLLALNGGGSIVRINLDDIICALALGLEDFQCFIIVPWSDYAVGYLALDNSRGRNIADIGKRNEIAEAAHSVRTARSCIRASKRRKLSQIINPINLSKRFGERKSYCRTRRRNVLKGSSRRLSCRCFKLLNQLPAVESVHKVNVTRSAIENLNGKLAVLHKNSGRLLIGVTAVFQFKFSHNIFLS